MSSKIIINKKNAESYIVTAIIGYCVLARFIPYMDNFIIKALLVMYAIVYVIKRVKMIPLFFVGIISFCAIALFFSGFNIENRILIKHYIFTFNAFFYIFMPPLLFMVERDPKKRLRELYVLSYFIVTILVLVLVAGGMSGEEYDYISLGSATLPYWAIIAQDTFINHSSKSAVVGIISGFILCLFASRGVGVSILAILIVYICIYTNLKHKIIVAVLGVFVVLLSSNIEAILMWIYQFFLNKGITIRFLYTFLFRNQISAFSMSSGRTEIWELAINAIKDNPLIGYGVMGDRKPLASYALNLWPHNMEIQIFMQFGVIIGTIIILFLVYIAVRMLKSNVSWKYLFIPYFFSSIFFLQISSEYYLYVNFWISIMIFSAYISDSNRQKKRKFVKE